MIAKDDGPFWLFGDHDFCKVFQQVLRVFQYIIWEDSLLLKEYPNHPWLHAVKSFNMTELVCGQKSRLSKKAPQARFVTFVVQISGIDSSSVLPAI